MTTAMIFGVSGQDGAYLARLLLQKGYRVIGASRDAQVNSFSNLHTLGIANQVEAVSVAVTDFRSVIQAVTAVEPDEIYNLAGQSSVGLSFQQPVETLESISVGTINILEAIRFLNLPIRFYNAGSSECFGDVDAPASEDTPFRPRSPYAVSKATAHWLVANYREAYGIFASSGILFNHESPLRHERFVTQKIVSSACRIAGGSGEVLRLGNLEIVRDWGWATEYVEAMWLMLKQDSPDDYVVATGESHSLRDFCEMCFSALALNWQDHLEVDPTLFRPTDLKTSMANPDKASRQMGWSSSTDLNGVIDNMIAAEVD